MVTALEQAAKFHEEALSDGVEVKTLIHMVRGRQVMLDSDLAALYEVETKVFNQAVKRNLQRFPERFRFQLTDRECDSLRSQIVTSNGRGGRRYNPYVFTEQGVAMLASVLRSDAAVKTSIAIMDAFVQMRGFFAANEGLLRRMDIMEARQLDYQRSTDRRFDQVFGYLETNESKESPQTIFFDGQIYDAFELLARLVKQAKRRIVLIDSYVDLDTLNILAKKRKGVQAQVYTTKRGCRITDADAEKFNAQYPWLEIKRTAAFHDRFLILDETDGYHIGASLKDAGKKCFGISKIEDEGLVQAVLERLDK